VSKEIHFIFILLLLPAAASLSCRLDVPIREMTNARKAIADARMVKAEKYAGVDLDAAVQKLMESQEQLSKKNVEGAKKSAEESASLAHAAYNKAIPILAGETISIAEKSFSDAGDVSADRLAPEEYRDAETKLKQARELFQNAKYKESYESAIKADESAKEARNTAISRKDVLRDSIVEVKKTLDEADQYGAKKYAPEKFNLANENVGIAEKSYDALELKKGFSALEVAKINADDALLTALKSSATDRLAAAEDVVAQARKSPVAAEKKDELNAAKESLDTAKAALDNAKYKESIAASEEAMRIAGGMTAEKGRGPAVAKTEEKGEAGAAKHEQSVVQEKDYDLYTVKYRKKYKDCLWYIAMRYYKNPWLWKKIYRFNKDKIKNPDMIYPGWVLKIPKLKK
jgi:hypothetical protein